MLSATGHDMGFKFIFSDGLGKLYIGLAVAWSVILACGTAILVHNRNLSFLRIRSVPLVVSAVATLHVYWLLCLLAYGFNGFYPCTTEFWIMNIYLPFGIALFHASNSQLLHVAAYQRRYTSTGSLPHAKQRHSPPGWRRYRQKLKGHNTMSKTLYYIAVGMIIQLVVSSLVFFLSRRFHSRMGVFGEHVTNDEAGRKLCRHGFEWIPSILWQIFWTWVYAPYVLWKVRNIRDVNGWRIQTICCCLAGLPASPMWLMALYLPQMETLGRYIVPPLWFVPSILLMEVFMIFVPCWQIVVNRRIKQETLGILAEWERQKTKDPFEFDTVRSPHSSRRSHEHSDLDKSTVRKAQSHLYTMTALEKALQTNPVPLLLFAALRDFSGENISFLNHVREWRQGWYSGLRYSRLLRSVSTPATADVHLRRKQFIKAVEIYSSFVSMKYSKFPINISSAHLKELQVVFEKSASLLHGESEISSSEVTPFDDWSILGADDIEKGLSKDNGSMLSAPPGDDASTDEIFSIPSWDRSRPRRHSGDGIIHTFKMKDLGDRLQTEIRVPAGFSSLVFDDASESVKYTVLTNTWPKFVNEGYAAKLERQGGQSTAEQIKERFCGMIA